MFMLITNLALAQDLRLELVVDQGLGSGALTAPLLSVQAGMDSGATPITTGGGRPVVAILVDRLTLTRRPDSDSDAFRQRLVSGAFPGVTVAAYRPHPTQPGELLAFTIEANIVRPGRIRTVLSTEGAPVETLELDYGCHRITHYDYTATGAPAGSTSTQWSAVTKSALFSPSCE